MMATGVEDAGTGTPPFQGGNGVAATHRRSAPIRLPRAVRAVIALSLAFVGTTSALGAQDNVKACPDPEADPVKEALAPYVESGEIPGYVSVLIEGSREAWTTDGWRDAERRLPMRADTVFRICSQTKGICGAAVAKLAVEGRLSLDDEVAKYFPEFSRLTRVSSDRGGVRTIVPEKASVTLRDCLSHTAGFPFETCVSKALGWTSTPPRLAAAIAAAEPLEYEPRSEWRYSNTGLDVAVAVVEKVTGEAIEDHLRRVLFEPLGMKDTTFKPTPEQQARLASVYSVTPGAACRRSDCAEMPRPYDSSSRHPSAGAGLFSTARDLAEFYRMLAFGGVARDGRRILPEAAITDVLAVKQTPKSITTPYSLGFFVVDGAIGHDGALKTSGFADPARRQVRLWMMQCTYAAENRWHQFNVWRPAADGFFRRREADGVDRMNYWGQTP